MVPVVLVVVDFMGLLRSSEYSSEENTDDGRRFSFCDENDEELEMDEVDSEGEASRDMDRSKGLSAGGNQNQTKETKGCETQCSSQSDQRTYLVELGDR